MFGANSTIIDKYLRVKKSDSQKDEIMTLRGGGEGTNVLFVIDPETKNVPQGVRDGTDWDVSNLLILKAAVTRPLSGVHSSSTSSTLTKIKIKTQFFNILTQILYVVQYA